jgi:hypothetical protein
MVHWLVLVHSGPKQATYNMHDKDFVITKKWAATNITDLRSTKLLEVSKVGKEKTLGIKILGIA